MARVGWSCRYSCPCQAAGWFGMTQAMRLPLLPGFEAVVAQYRGVVDRGWTSALGSSGAQAGCSESRRRVRRLPDTPAGAQLRDQGGDEQSLASRAREHRRGPPARVHLIHVLG